VQKARKLIERDQVNFVIGDVNSGIAAAISQVTSEKKVLHIVSGGHTDSITGEANSVSNVLFTKYGKKWHFFVSCSRRAHHRERCRHATLIALVALPGATLPATSCLGAFWTPAS
jgi:hypothetical protein